MILIASTSIATRLPDANIRPGSHNSPVAGPPEMKVRRMSATIKLGFKTRFRSASSITLLERRTVVAGEAFMYLFHTFLLIRRMYHLQFAFQV